MMGEADVSWFPRILLGCSFTGNIPKEIGNLTKLTFL
uniref:Uncharacterized protein n=1 Tax=Arundo donax TaxID=35708 RepID=A0A0A9BAH4_ARUDO